MRLILGSGSPRRQMMLEQLGVAFTVDKPDVDESVLPGESAENYVRRLAAEKGQIVAQRHGNAVVLAADTTVVHHGSILGKPVSREDCIEMLRSLSDSTHEVISGVAVIGSSEEVFSVTSTVVFRALTATEIEWYWQTGEPLDKAGSYGLQGAGSAFVSAIDGSYSNVIGLPLAEAVAALRRAGVQCLGECVADERDLNYAGQL